MSTWPEGTSRHNLMARSKSWKARWRVCSHFQLFKRDGETFVQSGRP